MKLSELHTKKSRKLNKAIKNIYGNDGHPASDQYGNVNQSSKDVGKDQGSRAFDARTSDPGPPWKLRYRRFFRTGDDSEPGSIRC